MAFREVSVLEVCEVLRGWLDGWGCARVAGRAGVDRKTARRYVAAAEAAGVCREGTVNLLVLTVAVIAAPVFDALFSNMVAVNEEGAAISTEASHPTVGIPFTKAARERLRTEPLSPIARACIEQAWQYRHQLLGR
ncbi:MAG: hypothetical protein ACRDQY_23030 [Pseudonocardiaceae bacterium]